VRFSYTMFRLQTSFKPLLTGGGGGRGSVSRGDCSKEENFTTVVLITSKNSASVLLILTNFVMQPVYVAKSNNPASLVDTQKI
jgi:hypothetical protein